MHVTIVLVLIISYYPANLISIFCSIEVTNQCINKYTYCEIVPSIEIIESADIFQMPTNWYRGQNTDTENVQYQMQIFL